MVVGWEDAVVAILVTEVVEMLLNYIEIRSGEDGILGCMCDGVYMPPGSGKLCAAGGWLPRLCQEAANSNA
jgi:hypothetical protein